MFFLRKQKLSNCYYKFKMYEFWSIFLLIIIIIVIYTKKEKNTFLMGICGDGMGNIISPPRGSRT